MTGAVLVACASGVVVVVLRRRSRGRADQPQPRRDLAVLAMQMARGTRSGLTPLELMDDSAGRLCGALGEQVGAVGEEMRRGTAFDDAMANWHSAALRAPTGRGSPDPADIELLSVAARCARRQGRGEAQAYESVASTLIDRAELADEVTSLTAQARASMLVLCALPLLGTATLSMVDGEAARVLVTTPLGLASVCLAAGLDLAALWIGARLIERALR